MKKAFTLIELLVVVLIIGILSAIALPQYSRAVERAQVSEAVQNVSQLQKAIDIYLLENGYPDSSVSFLGDDANGNGLLNVDVTKGMNCEGNYHCVSKYFTYEAKCYPTGQNYGKCSIMVDHYDYDLYLEKREDTGTWTRDCDYTEEKEYLCKSLEPQGFTRSSCC